MIKILELFGGIGACTKALQNLNINYKIVDYVEIDKYAVRSFNAMHNTNFEPQDICNWDKDIEVDLIMHGSPCQDFSLAGKQAGGDEGSGTRSSLMYETIRIVKKLKPKYIIWENVKNIISKRHKHNFDMYIHILNELGYKSYYKVFNAKDYGIPQNRERVFVISIRNYLNVNLTFPQPIPLKLKLKDMLEEEVDNKYYLSEKMKKYIFSEDNKYKVNKNRLVLNREIACSKTTREGWTRADTSDYITNDIIATYDEYNHKINGPETIGTIQAMYPTTNHGHRLLVKNNTKQGYLEAKEGDGINLNSRMKYQRGNVQKGVIQTLDTMCGSNKGVVCENLQIRKLTPKECWRLMGFDDTDFEKAKSTGNSDAQLYKQAGNSIVVNVLMAILKNLLKEEIE